MISPDITSSAKEARKHVRYVGKTIQKTKRRMNEHMFDYNKAVELDKVLTDKEEAMQVVFNSTQEMIVLHKSYGTKEVGGSVESILIDSGNPSLKIVYQMFPERNDEVAEVIFQDFLDANDRWC
uniref:Transposase n=1 Tax=Rhabditophanes sp. KR3021 TaxID=114890 RepID=A0AC35TQ98_9BILA